MTELIVYISALIPLCHSPIHPFISLSMDPVNSPSIPSFMDWIIHPSKIPPPLYPWIVFICLNPCLSFLQFIHSSPYLWILSTLHQFPHLWIGSSIDPRSMSPFIHGLCSSLLESLSVVPPIHPFIPLSMDPVNSSSIPSFMDWIIHPSKIQPPLYPWIVYISALIPICHSSNSSIHPHIYGSC